MLELVQLNKMQLLQSPFIGWLTGQTLIFESPAQVVNKLLSDVYIAFAGYDNDKPVGIIVCNIKGNECLTVVIYAVGVLSKFREVFYKHLKDNLGIAHVYTYSTHRSQGYERLTGMKHKYSYYEKEL